MNQRQLDLADKVLHEMQIKTKSTIAVQMVKGEERITELEAELAALRPLAALGERALRDGWYISSPDKAGDFYCYECRQMYGKHYSNCRIAALLAQLEDEYAKR